MNMNIFMCQNIYLHISIHKNINDDKYWRRSNLRASFRVKMSIHIILVMILDKIYISFCLDLIFGLRL